MTPQSSTLAQTLRLAALAAILCLATSPSVVAEEQDFCPFSVSGGGIAPDRFDAIQLATGDAEGACNEFCPDFSATDHSCTIRTVAGKTQFDCVVRGECSGDRLTATSPRSSGVWLSFEVSAGSADRAFEEVTAGGPFCPKSLPLLQNLHIGCNPEAQVCRVSGECLRSE